MKFEYCTNGTKCARKNILCVGNRKCRHLCKWKWVRQIVSVRISSVNCKTATERTYPCFHPSPCSLKNIYPNRKAPPELSRRYLQLSKSDGRQWRLFDLARLPARVTECIRPVSAADNGKHAPRLFIRQLLYTTISDTNIGNVKTTRAQSDMSKHVMLVFTLLCIITTFNKLTVVKLFNVFKSPPILRWVWEIVFFGTLTLIIVYNINVHDPLFFLF